MAAVYIPIPVAEVEEAGEASSSTYRLDLDAGRIQGRVDRLEAVNQAIRKAIITPRFRCLIYDNQYGCEIENAIKEGDVTQEYAESSIPGFVADALKPDGRVLGVRDFVFRFEDDKAYISFRADTIFGETGVEEVI